MVRALTRDRVRAIPLRSPQDVSSRRADAPAPAAICTGDAWWAGRHRPDRTPDPEP